ncbi:Zn-dependent hydrolase [Pseudohoeflea suaedae]|uniref:Zn-dependent hydrolase n=1 Tax=Pseudohoeflea suaedae TaxID=877384 RepID=A0A4R5PKV1_9HYPH|nr:Zn-dependent hydrolase [Pseudohoeflea suaedae]
MTGKTWDKKPDIDIDRLKTFLAGLNGFGANPLTGGFNRPGYSDADMAARAWFEARLKEAGLAVRRDGVANIFGRYGPAEGPAILVGSHIDTVPEGGGFDGALGVAVALECVKAMKDAGFEPSTAIEVVATAEEEGRFGGMLGSQAIAGRIDRAWFETAGDADGMSLQTALAAQGLSPEDAFNCRRSPDEVKAFLELHIEQGPVLEHKRIPIGLVDGISGVSNISVTLTGRANHSGTTPMDMRSDAFAGLAAFATRIPAIIGDHGTDQSRITIGKVELEPNFPHTIPGRAVFSVITRDTDEKIQHALLQAVKAEIDAAAHRHHLSSEIKEKSWLSPVALDPKLQDLLASEAQNLGLSHIRMPSGAGHDAQTMQSLCPSALIFIPSRAGISHAPEEHSEWADILAGARLMLSALVRLSSHG